MKQLSLLLCLTAIGLQAQTLNSYRNYFRSGDVIIKQQVEFKDPGASGKDITWDFSMLNSIDDKYQIDYFNATMGDTAHVIVSEHSTRYHYELRNDTLWMTSYENRTSRMTFEQPEAQLHFPFHYGDSLNRTFSGKGMYCETVGLVAKGLTSVTADATGMLITPTNDTLKNILRVKRLRNYSEIGVDSTRMQLITYSWYALGYRYPVFETIKSMVLRGDSTTESFSTSFYYPISDLQNLAPDPANDNIKPDKATDITSVFTEAQLMPNPVLTDMTINYKLTRNAKVWFTVHNNTGVALCQTAPQNLSEGFNSTTVTMGNLITGVYSLYVHVDDMVKKLNVVKK